MKIRHWVLGVAGLVWISVVPMGLFFLERAEATPVPASQKPSSFPRQSSIKLAADKPTLVLFFHPYCPCSTASLSELDRILAETQAKLSVIVVFTIAKGEPTGWEQTSLWKSAATMPGVTVQRDPGGETARAFAVTGSGHALLYDTAGKLLFSGGITDSRGHEGDNAGQAAIVDLVLRGTSLVTHTPVYGCRLL